MRYPEIKFEPTICDHPLLIGRMLSRTREREERRRNRWHRRLWRKLSFEWAIIVEMWKEGR